MFRNSYYLFCRVYTYVYIYIYILAKKWQFSRIQTQIESYQKWYLMLPRLILSIIRYGSRVSGTIRERSSALPYTSVLKESLQVTVSRVGRLTIIYRPIDIMVSVFSNSLEDRGSIPGHVILKTQKMVLDATLLNTQHYKVRIKDKVEQWSNTLTYTSE